MHSCMYSSVTICVKLPNHDKLNQLFLLVVHSVNWFFNLCFNSSCIFKKNACMDRLSSCLIEDTVCDTFFISAALAFVQIV